MAKSLDVWLGASDTIYKGVPLDVAAGWATSGRLAGQDKVRPAGTNDWVVASQHPVLSDYFVSRASGVGPGVATAAAGEAVEPQEVDHWVMLHDDEDDDVDMIPLIDISLVLLIYFMMTAAVATLSPVDVPDMTHASEIRKDDDAMVIEIDQRRPGEVVYAVRVGDRLAPEDSNLQTPEDAIRQLKAKLVNAARPPEVRIACHKDLPRDRLRDIARELDALKQKEQIAYYGAEVIGRDK